jgi:uncharacterized lipoprotein NlpE involved in copper resistance
MKNTITTLALTLVILLAVGCENKRQSRKAESSTETKQDAKVTVAAQGDANRREHSERTPAGSTTAETVALPTGDAPKADAEILVPVKESADSQAETLGNIRKQLAELVQEAVKTQKGLLEAQLDAAKHTPDDQAHP